MEAKKRAKYANAGFGPSAIFFPTVGSTSGERWRRSNSLAYHVAEAKLTSRALELKKLTFLLSTSVMKQVASDLKQVVACRQTSYLIDSVGISLYSRSHLKQVVSYRQHAN